MLELSEYDFYTKYENVIHTSESSVETLLFLRDF